MTKSEIDRLGDRLRWSDPSEADLRLLHQYRQSFSESYEEVVRALSKLELQPTGRSAKSTTSIVESEAMEEDVLELQRRSGRLSAEQQRELQELLIALDRNRALVTDLLQKTAEDPGRIFPRTGQ